jgi:hypothetical protein
MILYKGGIEERGLGPPFSLAQREKVSQGIFENLGKTPVEWHNGFKREF